MEKSDLKLRFLYRNLIDSDFIEKDEIPTAEKWKNDHSFKDSWFIYLKEIQKQNKFFKKILVNNDFYKYMQHLSKHY